MRFYMSCAAVAALRIKSSHFFIGSAILAYCKTIYRINSNKSLPLSANKAKKMHRSGFVNIIGNPNVGKSTLMNALVGEKLSIITSKAQTTRHRIMGIVSGEDYQIVYSDTPGILKPSYKLQ